MRGKKTTDRTNPSQRRIQLGRHLVQEWHISALLLLLYDAVAVNLAYFLALWFRFDCHFSSIQMRFFLPWVHFIPIHTIICLFTFWTLRLYHSIWRYASYSEMLRVILSSLITFTFHAVGITLLYGRMPISYLIIGAVLQVLLILGVRFSYRFIILLREQRSGEGDQRSRVMLIGAGDAGQMLLRDLKNSPRLGDNVCCIIDDDPKKQRRYLDGVPIVGGRDDILLNAEKYEIDKIYLAIPSASMADKRDILNICSETGCELKQLPGMYQLVLGQVTASAMRNVSVEDLLGREPIKENMDEVFRAISGKVVLVTGGGGSIGSELCRQIAAHGPKQLIIFDIYENNAYDIQLELRDRYPGLDLQVQIGSVRDSRRLDQLFSRYRPHLVYHAAAHKHVPLMEDSPCEAVKNNAVGTYKTAYAAMVHGCQRFVLISTDKAVNPTNIMGASKRLCEMIIQSFDAKIRVGKADELPRLFTHGHSSREAGGPPLPAEVRTEFVGVRFGNVLGSNGSVIPVFKKQIAKGGPVTVTHPDIIRYFMTIPEAVSLVLLAGTYAHGGELFVLDMGSPVKIDALARNLIRLSGFKPDVDIKIQYTGLRPGEKLYEEKLMAEEGLRKTDNEKIHIGQPIDFDTDEFLTGLADLMEAAYANREDIVSLVEKLVSTFHPVGRHPAAS